MIHSNFRHIYYSRHAITKKHSIIYINVRSISNMSPADLVRASQLKHLLLTALSDSSIYSALVPWVLDADFKVGQPTPKS